MTERVTVMQYVALLKTKGIEVSRATVYNAIKRIDINSEIKYDKQLVILDKKTLG